MEVTKGKYKITLAEEDKNAVLRVMNMAATFCDENLCTNKDCETCPLSAFCLYEEDNNEKIKVFIDKLEKFVNEE